MESANLLKTKYVPGHEVLRGGAATTGSTFCTAGTTRAFLSPGNIPGWEGPTKTDAVEGGRLLLYRSPTSVGIELSHCGCCLCCGAAQIFLQQHAILVDGECHYSRIAVLGRIRDESESTDHLPVDHVVLRATLCVTALPAQHMEVVTMKGHVRVGLHAVSFSGCERCQRPERASGLILL